MKINLNELRTKTVGQPFLLESVTLHDINKLQEQDDEHFQNQQVLDGFDESEGVATAPVLVIHRSHIT